MMNELPNTWKRIMHETIRTVGSFLSFLSEKKQTISRKNWYFGAIIVDLCIILMLTANPTQQVSNILSPIVDPLSPLKPLQQSKSDHEVFGFAPHWTIDSLENVNFDVLTTLAYFSLEVASTGHIITDDPGYQTFYSNKATNLFKKAHAHGTRVVLTLTQMNNADIRAIMDDKAAQDRLIKTSVAMVKDRGIDGINVDFEYSGNPGPVYRQKFTIFMQNLIAHMHQEVPGSKVSVSVYASAIKEPKIYNISDLGKEDLMVFMMAYDFGYRGSEQVIPTAPLYGHKEGKYWYDVSTAVEDFLVYMPAEKLILGTPWYGYNYAIYGEPRIKANTLPYGAAAQTYTIGKVEVTPARKGAATFKEGWDESGKVGWKAYYDAATGAWRMVFLEDVRSLAIKYDYAKTKNLGGVGMWALGFDNGQTELWDLLESKFGRKIADAHVAKRTIYE